MTYKTLINEIMWEYNCTKKAAINLIKRYETQGRYKELVNIVQFKRTTPEIERR